jgi:MFS family permease
MWLVWELTGNELFSGLAGFLTLAPAALQFLFGPLVDRWPLRRLLVATQLLQGLLVLVMPLAAATGNLSVWVVLALMPLLSLLNQLAYPAETAALPRIVDRDELVGANSLFALAYQGVDAAFTAVAGLLVAAVGAVAVFALDAVTFAVAAALFATLSVRPARDTGVTTGVDAVTDGGEPVDGGAAGAPAGYLAELREGIDYLRGTFLVAMVGGSLVINFALGATLAVLPSYAASVAGPAGYGLLMTALGAGVLVGALSAATVAGVAFGRLAVAAFLVSGVAWLGAVAVGWLPGTVALLVVALVPVGLTNVLILSAVQATVPEGLLGRVTAVLGSASTAATPFGALAGGAAAAAVGPAPVMAVPAVGFMLLAAYFAAVPTLRGLPAVGEFETVGGGDPDPNPKSVVD